MAVEELLKTENLSAGYSGKTVISGIGFSLKAGHILGILGGNGCGKTTLIKSVCGILPCSGLCETGGKAVRSMSPRERAGAFAYVPQESGLSMELTCLDIVLMGFHPKLGLLERPSAGMIRLAKDMLRKLGLGEKISDSYLTLSGGQKRLCLLARAFVTDGKVLFLDEPESALDFSARYKVMGALREWISGGAPDPGRGAVVSLHDPQLALNCCDELLLMNGNGESRLICPANSELRTLETEFQKLYGPLRIIEIGDSTGKKQFALISGSCLAASGEDADGSMSGRAPAGCVILASGEGKRFGGKKLTADFDGAPMILRLFKATEDVFSDRVAVIRDEELRKICEAEGVRTVLHSFPEKRDTIRLGLTAACEKNISGCFFFQADQPLLSEATVRKLAACAAEAPEYIWRAAWHGTGKSPVYFPAWSFQELLSLPANGSGRNVILSHPELVRLAEAENEYELEDADTGSRLKELECLLRQRQ